MTALAQRDPIEEVREYIVSADFGQQLAQALPPTVTLDRFTAVTLTAIQQNPELITADRKSLFNSVLKCAADGLIPDGREAALVIFTVKGEKKCQYMPMVDGLRKQAAKHGFRLSATAVHEHDEFDYELGLEPRLTHKPAKLGTPRGELIGAYATVTDEQGRHVLPPEVMGKDEIDKVRAVSKTGKSEYGPWANWYEQMARKTVARRAFKQIPLAQLDDASRRILEASDSESDFGEPDRMSVEEANLNASLMTGTTPADSGPVDTIDGEASELDDIDFGAAPLPDTGHLEETVAELTDKLIELAEQMGKRQQVEDLVAANRVKNTGDLEAHATWLTAQRTRAQAATS